MAVLEEGTVALSCAPSVGMPPCPCPQEHSGSSHPGAVTAQITLFPLSAAENILTALSGEALFL